MTQITQFVKKYQNLSSFLYITDQQQEQPGKNHRYQVEKALVNAELSVVTPEISADADVISGNRREELARIFSAEQPVSDIILEDRG